MQKAISKKEKIFRLILWAGLEVFVFATLVYIWINGDVTHLLMCLGTLVLLCLPFLASKLLKFEMNGVFFVFCQLYAIGPMLGHIYKLYYLTTWWDNLLHASGGVVFAIFGVYLAKLFNKEGTTSVLMKAMFALFFSIALAGLWEFVEYACDVIFHTDMQNDTVIKDIYSYLLGENLGEAGMINNIHQVIINGKELGLGGYIDIGLHDTMSDMLWETAGAVVFVVVYLLDKEKHPLLYETEYQKG